MCANVRKALAQISREHRVDPESNYSFGEGGAGAYSDGKLYTRSKKRGNVDKILNVFCQHGASTAILVDAHPHIGTDKLPRVIENMRNTIIECGGEVHFKTRMDALIIEQGEVKGIETNTGETFLGPVILKNRSFGKRCISLAGRQQCDYRSQRNSRRSASGTSCRIDRPNTIPQPERQRQIPAGCRIQFRHTSGRPRSIQFLHVSRGIHRTGGQRSRTGGSQRNVAIQSRIPVE